jgi:alpha-soluble NSF attachment protein
VARYDQVASQSLGSALTKYSVKDYWLKALLCVLATTVFCPSNVFGVPPLMIHQDYVSARRNLTRYGQMDATFPSTREAKFVTALLEALEEGNEEMFTNAVFEYDQVTKLDNWKTAILLKIKRGIQQAPGLT